MSIFDDVKGQLNIRQVVEHYGFRVNRAHQFVCPFHNDHKPSASIKDDYFNCFVCGAGGDLITFTAKYLGISNFDAAIELVRVFNLNIDISTAEEKRERFLHQRKIQQQRKKEERKEYTSRREAFESRKTGQRTKKTKLRSEVRQSRIRQEKEQEEYIYHAGLVLSDFHRHLWQGIHLYPYGHERHIKGLQELTVCQYYIDCYDDDSASFCKYNKGVIDRYEKELNSISTEREQHRSLREPCKCDCTASGKGLEGEHEYSEEEPK